MKIKNYFLLVVIALFTTCVVTSCDNDELNGLTRANQVLDSNQLRALLTDGLSAPHDTLTQTGGVYWKETQNYNNSQNLVVGNFTLSHTAGYEAAWDWVYWGGFTASSVNDSQCYTNFNVPASSLWTNHQWGCMAANNGSGEYTPPFVIGYWSSDETPLGDQGGTFSESEYSLWIKLNTPDNIFTPQSIQICFHPWPYWDIELGGSYSLPFDKNGNKDYFKLLIYGVDSKNNISSNYVEHAFVDYTKNPKVTASTDWVTISDFNGIEDVKYLLFQMDSSNKNQYGLLTSTYFCMRGLTVATNN